MDATEDDAAENLSNPVAEAVRQAMLRDPTYRPALDAARHLSESAGFQPQALNQPARGCASTSFGRVSVP